ncbi:MAG: dihydrolipoamide succinyltransferase [Coxiella sp. RIFCSPHIGHO2_12_FULL_44_14]|nr:MAG: dihydrolipoamide succinyltransferase [Coxiella sp. RIFCSPHIGHO2_12_FULL_44_14]
MAIEIKVPVLPESVADATVAKWYKKVGDAVARDENLVDLETDKVMLEVPVPYAGILESILVKEGDTVTSDQLLATLQEGSVSVTPEEITPTPEAIPSSTRPSQAEKALKEETKEVKEVKEAAPALSPSVRRRVTEENVDVRFLQGTGKEGRITKPDVESWVERRKPEEKPTAEPKTIAVTAVGTREEKRVPMSRLRARIAERLSQVQQEAVLLTSFNEINMKPVMDLRKRYQEQFEKVHGVRLGLMSFFTRAVTEALKRFPIINASVDGNDVIYHGYCDVGIAIGAERGLIVPILRNVEGLSLAAIEKQIRDFALRAQTGKLTIEEITGGTFTITNGGTFGSLLSTPIINPPQTAILGMHKMMDRPVVDDGQIVIRPMMYVALSYDHRIIDGREAVLFLVAMKELLEDPARILLDI